MLIMMNIYFQKEKLQRQDFEFLFSQFHGMFVSKLSCDSGLCVTELLDHSSTKK